MEQSKELTPYIHADADGLTRWVAIAAIVVIAAVVALMVGVRWAAPLARSGVGAEDAIPNAAGAGVAAIHDDAGNMPTDAQWGALQHHGLYYPLPHGKAAPGAGSVVIHDDPGNGTAQ